MSLSHLLIFLVFYAVISPTHSFFIKKLPHYDRSNNCLFLQPIEIEFLPSKIKCSANIGDSLMKVAEKAEVKIPYKCKKGECGTCEVKVDGKWIKACQSTVPNPSFGYQLRVTVRPANENAKKPSTFFSPASFVEGIVNNGLGVVGFATQALSVDDEFEQRMAREKKLQEKLAEKKAAQQGMN